MISKDIMKRIIYAIQHGDIERAISEFNVEKSNPPNDSERNINDLISLLTSGGWYSEAADVGIFCLEKYYNHELFDNTITSLLHERRISEVGRIAIGEIPIANDEAKPTSIISDVTATLKKQLELNSSRDDIWALIGNLYSRSGQNAEAIDALRQACKLTSNNLTNLSTLAQLLYVAGDYQASTNAFLGITAIDPQNSDAIDVLKNMQGYINTSFTDNSPTKNQSLSNLDRAYLNHERLILTDKILEITPNTELVVIDGGARDAHRDVRWRPLFPKHVTIYGFEPDTAECDRLNAELLGLSARGEYFPVGLWSTNTCLPMEVNKASGGHSFLPQNIEVTDRWKFENPSQTAHAKDVFRPIENIDMDVVSLKTWAEKNDIERFDFCKLNVQGAEIEILKGAEGLLKSTLGILVEVAFVESYQDRPMFSDVDSFLRENNFVFFDLLAHHYVGRSASQVATQHFSNSDNRIGKQVSSWGQLVEGHALYLRDPIEILRQNPHHKIDENELIKLVIIAEVFGQVEYGFELIHWFAEHHSSSKSQLLAKVAADAEKIYRRIHLNENPDL